MNANHLPPQDLVLVSELAEVVWTRLCVYQTQRFTTKVCRYTERGTCAELLVRLLVEPIAEPDLQDAVRRVVEAVYRWLGTCSVESWREKRRAARELVELAAQRVLRAHIRCPRPSNN